MSLITVVCRIAKYVGYIAISWLLIRVVYRVAFHPLRKYPGPFWAKATYAYGGYYGLTKVPHIHIYQNFQKYGSVYREWPDRLLFNSLNIYSNSTISKGPSYSNLRWLNGRQHMFETPNEAEHSRLRKIVGQVLSDRTLRGFEPILIHEVDILLGIILKASQRNKAVDVTVVVRRLAIDIIGHLSLGWTLHTQTDTHYRFLSDAMSGTLFISNMFVTWTTFSYILPVLLLIARSDVVRFESELEHAMRTRMAQPVDAQVDFYSITAGKLKIDRRDLLKAELWAEAVFFITAGGSTTSSGSSATLFYLSRNPDVYARLAREIRGTFTSGSDIRSGPTLAGCKYLRAVLDESLRISPPVLLSLWRAQESKSSTPLVVDGHVIPPGTEVAVHIWSILHSEDFFPEPFSFQPDRFLDPEDGKAPNRFQDPKVKEVMQQAFIPFGLGSRNCGGKSLAYLEMSLTIAKILWYFDFEAAPGMAGKVGGGEMGSPYPWGGPGIFQLRDIIAADHDGPNLVFKPRGEHWRDLTEKED